MIVTDFVTDLAGTTAQTLTKIGEALSRGAARKKHYYLEFRGKAPNGAPDTLATGTVQVDGRISNDENAGWEQIAASHDVTAAASTFLDFAGAYLELRFTPATFEADHTVDVFVRVVDD